MTCIYIFYILIYVYSLEEEIATQSNSLAWKSHGQRGQAAYSPKGGKESDMTEWLREIERGVYHRQYIMVNCYSFYKYEVSLTFKNLPVLVNMEEVHCSLSLLLITSKNWKICAKEGVASSAGLMSEQTYRSWLHLYAGALLWCNRESSISC